MPAEPITLFLRPKNFFTRNPALDVPPSYSSTPSQKARITNPGILDAANRGFGPVV